MLGSQSDDGVSTSCWMSPYLCIIPWCLQLTLKRNNVFFDNVLKFKKNYVDSCILLAEKKIQTFSQFSFIDSLRELCFLENNTGIMIYQCIYIQQIYSLYKSIQMSVSLINHYAQNLTSTSLHFGCTCAPVALMFPKTPSPAAHVTCTYLLVLTSCVSTLRCELLCVSRFF